MKDYLLLSKFICIDCNSKNSVPIKINYGGKNNNGNTNINEEEKNNEINFDELLKYKKNLEKMQLEFCDVFNETNLKKQKFECQIMEMKEKEEKNKKTETIEKKPKSGESKIKKKFIGRKIKRTGKKKK